MKMIVSRFANDESGATGIEYGLIAALICVAMISGFTAFGGTVNTMYRNLAGKLTAASQQPGS